MMDPRAAIFAEVRKVVPGVWNDPGNILAMDNILDALGVPRADRFTAALVEVLRHEGGYVNHHKDPGGRTNLGVTQRTWEAWTGTPATEAEMRSLTIEQVTPLYRKEYWNKVRGDELPAALALCVFDFAVNAGPARAARYLQTMVGTDRDGIVGPRTIAAANVFCASVGEREAVRRYQEARRGYYRQLSTFKTFGKGWLSRVDAIEAAALEMLG